MLIIGHNVGWKLYGPRNALIAERTGPADLAAHHTTFLEAVRKQRTEQTLDANVAAGHRAATVVHLANIAARVGRVLEFDAGRERVTNDPEADRLLSRSYRTGNWAVPAGIG
jgi:hypothetical protein